RPDAGDGETHSVDCDRFPGHEPGGHPGSANGHHGTLPRDQLTQLLHDADEYQPSTFRGSAVNRRSGPTRVTSTSSSSIASAMVLTPASTRAVGPAPSSLGARYPITLSTRPRARKAPASRGPPSSSAARTSRSYNL